MNILITIIIVLGSLVALFLIIALLTKKECRIEKQTVINKHKQEVFNYLKLLKKIAELLLPDAAVIHFNFFSKKILVTKIFCWKIIAS